MYTRMFAAGAGVVLAGAVTLIWAQSGSSTDGDLISKLQTNVEVQEKELQHATASYRAGAVSAGEMKRAELAVADAQLLVARVSKDLDAQRQIERARISLLESMLERAMATSSIVDSTREAAELHQRLAEARVRLWELKQ